MSGWVALTVLVLLGTAVAGALWFYRRTLYAGPWFLLLGPEDDRAALLAGARKAAVPPGARAASGDASGLSWHFFESGAIVDVAAHVALPVGDPDALGWERALQLLTRQRRRRPADGIIVAVPAALLSGADWLARAHDLGGTIRDRLLQAQRYFGFALPVYVVVTRTESMRGFDAFTRVLPAGLLPNMFGWSNPRPLDQPFSGEWVTEGFAELHRTLARLQVEIFATRRDIGGDASDLLLFSREVPRLMAPLRALLEEMFRPGLGQEAFFFRGFYLCGDAAHVSTAMQPVGRHAETLIRAPAPAAAFVQDLLEWKIFPEGGLARPLAGRVRATRRALAGAGLAVTLLAVLLAAGTVYAYVKARQVRSAYAELFVNGHALLESRRPSPRAARTAGTAEPLAQSRRFLEQLQGLGSGRLGSIFMPASLVRSLDARVSDMVTRVSSDVVLSDLRHGLRQRAADWLAVDAPDVETLAPAGPALDDNVYYQRLARFAGDYESIADGVWKYEQMASGHGPRDLSGASDVLAVLTAAPLESHAVPPAMGRAVQAARGEPLGCDIFEAPSMPGSLVGLRASRLLDEFGSASFGDDNPLLVAGTAFSADWSLIREGLAEPGVLIDLMDDTAHLVSAAAAWGPIGARSQAMAIPVFARAPFTPFQPGAPGCAALRPDLSAAMTRVVEQRDRLSGRVLELQVEPFGPLLHAGARGLALHDGIAALNKDFDVLRAESFWAPPPMDSTGALPLHAVWPSSVFDEVLRVADAHDSYRTRGFGHLPVVERQRLLAAVRSEVARIVAARLVVTAVPAGAPAADPQQRLEDITAVGAQLSKAGRLVPLLAADPSYGTDVLAALDQQGVRALQDLDRLAAARYPGVFGQQFAVVFTAWSDLQRGATPPEALKQWSGVVEAQHAGIEQLAQAARPIVQFLGPRQRSELVRRWNGVVADVAASDEQRVDSGLRAFDTALREAVPSVAPENGCRVSWSGPASHGAGYFAGVQKEIVQTAVRQCRALVEERYGVIAAGFNRLLAGRAPFRPDAAAAPEATPAQLAEFLTIYERQSGRGLRPALEAQACSAEALTFVRNIDSLDALVGGMRAATPPALALDVLPEFRIGSPLDVGADQIAEWRMEVGSHTFDDDVPAKPVAWKSGEPVAVALRFARNSPNRPAGSITGARVQERWVRFEFGGTWALLQLLRAGRGAMDTAHTADPTVLGFQIPVERDPDTPPLATAPASSPFTASMRLRLSPAGTPDAVPIGDLPTVAPARLACAGT